MKNCKYDLMLWSIYNLFINSKWTYLLILSMVITEKSDTNIRRYFLGLYLQSSFVVALPTFSFEKCVSLIELRHRHSIEDQEVI